ncbi:MAG: DoxX family membrane protein [Betaproteobacteria bacterium]|nr:DoxX family membrane protein [Betaproteobacteria bacterium]
MAQPFWQLPLRLTLGSYFLYSGIRKFEHEAPSRMEPLVRKGYPHFVDLVGFETFFSGVRWFEVLVALGLLTGKAQRWAGAAAALFGGMLLVLIWRLPDTFHAGSHWRLSVNGMNHLKNLWIVGIGLALMLAPGGERQSEK